MSARVLVAGVGNIFLGDDAFGVEVARRLADEPLPDGVQVTDFGIGGIHLAYELLEGYDTVILVDAMPRGERPGTVYVTEPESAPHDRSEAQPNLATAGAITDAHSMEPASVLQMVETLGISTRVVIVGCEPAELDERIGLSPVVAESVDVAVGAVLALLDEQTRTVGSGRPASMVPGGDAKREES
ncbi:MAG TPA: hydrogenase maturation protease [Acidimicrobiales bacterium]|nr:hydrogenase maturation protease [Acidimicrobiales bacterium]